MIFVNYCIPVEFTALQVASCIHRQIPYHTCYQVAMTPLFWVQKGKLNAKYSTRACEMKSKTCRVIPPERLKTRAAHFPR